LIFSRPLGRHRDIEEDNIKIHLQEVGWTGGREWIDLAQDRESWWEGVNVVMNLRVPYTARNLTS
jgi:hypothetical protein